VAGQNFGLTGVFFSLDFPTPDSKDLHFQGLGRVVLPRNRQKTAMCVNGLGAKINNKQIPLT